MEKNKKLWILIAMVLIYGCSMLTPIGSMIFEPIEILVAFLHEFGHAVMALITGGHVYSMKVNLDGSGVTTTSGGYMPLIAMGGYIGSCVFSNILIRASFTKSTKRICFIFSVLMSASSLLWANSFVSIMIITFYSLLFGVLSMIPRVAPLVLQFVGVACVIHILQDFRVGPSGDLDQFEHALGILPKFIWMYIWLIIVILVTYINIKRIINEGNTSNGSTTRSR